MTTPLLAIAELASSQAQKEVTANEAFRVLEAFTNPRFLDRDLATPPGSPAESDMYLVAASPTGAWSGQAAKIALYLGGSWRFFTPYEGLFAWVNDEDKLLRYAGGAWAEFTSGAGSSPTESLVIAASDETTALAAGAGKVTFRMPYAFTLSAVRASLTTAQTSGSVLTVDINEGGSSILSTKLTIDNGEKTSTTAATAAVISDTALANDAEITIDIDQVGDGTAKGLKIVLIGSQP